MQRLGVLLLVLGLALPARAEPAKEFMTTSTFGVLAGTIVGAASLAFTDKPGDNLNNIARGASLGLYAGILLGAYIVYAVPSGAEEEEGEDGQEPAPGATEGEAPPEDAGLRLESVFPMVSKNQIDGLGVSFRVLSF